MTLRRKQVAAAVLGCSSVVVGLWAQLAPRSFFDSFPLPGHRWIAPTGAFNEHLIRDVGNVVTLAGVAVLGFLLLVPAEHTERMDAKPHRASTGGTR